MIPIFTVEAMAASDWEQVREIYLEGVATGHATFEQDAPSWEKWDAARLPHSRLVAGLGCGTGSQVAGWAALSPASDRCAYAGVAEVSVYVAARHRGQGVGARLLNTLIEVSEAAGIWTLQAQMFPENRASLSLHMRCGFREVGRRERLGQMRGVWRDVLLFERRSSIVGV